MGITFSEFTFLVQLFLLKELKGTACVCLLLRPSEDQLLEKMKLNCQVLKDEITLFHLNRQEAHLCEILEKVQAKVI